MSSRAELYGIVSGSAGMSTGLNGEQVQTYWVDTSFGGERWIGFSVKDEVLTAGEVVTIIECGEDGDPWAAWAGKSLCHACREPRQRPNPGRGRRGLQSVLSFRLSCVE